MLRLQIILQAEHPFERVVSSFVCSFPAPTSKLVDTPMYRMAYTHLTTTTRASLPRWIRRHPEGLRPRNDDL